MHFENSSQIIRKYKESEQEKIILDELCKFTNQRTRNLESSIQQILKKISTRQHALNELEQEKEILQEINESLQRTAKGIKSRPLLFLASLTIITISLSFYYVISSEQEFDASPLVSRYVIENLRGDKIDTWQHWNIPKDRTLYVSIQNPNLVSQEKLELIKNAVLSEEKTSVDDYLQHKAPRGFKSDYYFGWAGALEEARKESTLYSIPDLEIMESSKSYKADIIISLASHRDSDGFSGYTKSTVEGEQILKSNITIYQANKLTENGLETIVRHEFGHALGLGHSTAEEDLMAQEITTPYPFVSECDVDAIVSLYNGNEQSQVVCEK